MIRFVVLLNFTEKGAAAVKESVARAEAFRASSSKAGANVETMLWTQGAYDGIFVLSAPDEATAAGLVLSLGRAGNVRSCMLRAFDADEFKEIVGKIG